MSARSETSQQPYPEFKEVFDKRPFFASLRVPKPPPIKPVKHDVPTLVVPNQYQLRMLTSRTPRTEMLTLPPVHPGSHVGSKTARPFQGSVTPRRGAPQAGSGLSGAGVSSSFTPSEHQPTPVTKSAVPLLPQLTFSTTADLNLVANRPSKAAVAERFRSRLTEYADHDEETATMRNIAAQRNRDEITGFERRHATVLGGEESDGIVSSNSFGGGEHHTVTTIDEEASTRVLKVMFQLNLTRNSNIISRLKELDPQYLHRKVIHELGYKKQMSRDEFFVLLCKVLKDDYINKRDCMTLFSVFDDDKSGLVDAVEFVSGFMTLIAAGEHDIAFKFIHTVLDSRGEKTIVNAFISRFELQLLVAAAQHHFASDPDIVRLLDGIPSAFNFSHHLGRIPIVQFRDKISGDDDLMAIFSALPNPSRPAKEAAANAAAHAVAGRKADKSVAIQLPDQALDGSKSEGAFDSASQMHILADQYMSQNFELQHHAEEHDSPRWWVSGGIVYRSSDSNPYPQPVFLKDNEKRR